MEYYMVVSYPISHKIGPRKCLRQELKLCEQNYQDKLQRKHERGAC